MGKNWKNNGYTAAFPDWFVFDYATCSIRVQALTQTLWGNISSKFPIDIDFSDALVSNIIKGYCRNVEKTPIFLYFH